MRKVSFAVQRVSAVNDKVAGEPDAQLERSVESIEMSQASARRAVPCRV
jgi:hypothetical protein